MAAIVEQQQVIWLGRLGYCLKRNQNIGLVGMFVSSMEMPEMKEWLLKEGLSPVFCFDELKV